MIVGNEVGSGIVQPCDNDEAKLTGENFPTDMACIQQIDYMDWTDNRTSTDPYTEKNFPQSSVVRTIPMHQQVISRASPFDRDSSIVDREIFSVPVNTFSDFHVLGQGSEIEPIEEGASILVPDNERGNEQRDLGERIESKNEGDDGEIKFIAVATVGPKETARAPSDTFPICSNSSSSGDSSSGQAEMGIHLMENIELIVSVDNPAPVQGLINVTDITIIDETDSSSAVRTHKTENSAIPAPREISKYLKFTSGGCRGPPSAVRSEMSGNNRRNTAEMQESEGSLETESESDTCSGDQRGEHCSDSHIINSAQTVELDKLYPEIVNFESQKMVSGKGIVRTIVRTMTCALESVPSNCADNAKPSAVSILKKQMKQNQISSSRNDSRSGNAGMEKEVNWTEDVTLAISRMSDGAIITGNTGSAAESIITLKTLYRDSASGSAGGDFLPKNAGRIVETETPVVESGVSSLSSPLVNDYTKFFETCSPPNGLTFVKKNGKLSGDTKGVPEVKQEKRGEEYYRVQLKNLKMENLLKKNSQSFLSPKVGDRLSASCNPESWTAKSANSDCTSPIRPTGRDLRSVRKKTSFDADLSREVDDMFPLSPYQAYLANKLVTLSPHIIPYSSPCDAPSAGPPTGSKEDRGVDLKTEHRSEFQLNLSRVTDEQTVHSASHSSSSSLHSANSTTASSTHSSPALSSPLFKAVKIKHNRKESNQWLFPVVVLLILIVSTVSVLLPMVSTSYSPPGSLPSSPWIGQNNATRVIDNRLTAMEEEYRHMLLSKDWRLLRSAPSLSVEIFSPPSSSRGNISLPLFLRASVILGAPPSDVSSLLHWRGKMEETMSEIDRYHDSAQLLYSVSRDIHIVRKTTKSTLFIAKRELIGAMVHKTLEDGFPINNVLLNFSPLSSIPSFLPYFASSFFPPPVHPSSYFSVSVPEGTLVRAVVDINIDMLSLPYSHSQTASVYDKMFSKYFGYSLIEGADYLYKNYYSSENNDDDDSAGLGKPDTHGYNKDRIKLPVIDKKRGPIRSYHDQIDWFIPVGQETLLISVLQVDLGSDIPGWAAEAGVASNVMDSMMSLQHSVERNRA